jgi:hypothetical protein
VNAVLASRALRVGLCAALALGHGCTLVDLSSRINQAGCDTDSQCATLNDGSDPSLRDCQAFVCSVRHLCEPKPLDADADGFAPTRCASEPGNADCNDLDPATHPGAEELCDELDNDCDGHTDEGALSLEQNVAVSFDERTIASDMASAVDLASSRIALGYLIDPSQRLVAANVVDYEELSFQNVTPLQYMATRAEAVRGANVSVAMLPLHRLAVGSYVTDAPARLVVNAVEGGSALAAGRGTDYGLNCAPNEACAANSSNPVPALASPPSTAPAMSVGADGLLVAYVRSADVADAVCATAKTVDTHRILANLVTSAGSGIAESSHAAVMLGESAQARAPALAAMPGSTTNGRAYGWLLAYPDGDGALTISQVSLVEAEIRVSAPLLSIEPKAGALSEPQLLLGRAGVQHASFGLVALQGCGADTRVVMAQLDATLDSLGGIALRQATKLTQVGGADQQRGASLAYNSARQSWGLAYRDALGVRARIVDDKGVATGDEPYLLLAEEPSDQLAQSTAITPLISDHGWFAVFAYTEQAQEAAGQVLRMTLRSCGPL